MRLIVPLMPVLFNQQLLQVPKAVAPTAVPLNRSREGSVIYCEIVQDQAGENESDKEVWNTVHVWKVGLWIMGSHAEDGR